MAATIHAGGSVTHFLRTVWPRHTVKQAARAAGVPVETARSWVKGYSSPNANTLLRMADTCEALAIALERRLADRRAARAAGSLAQTNQFRAEAPRPALELPVAAQEREARLALAHTAVGVSSRSRGGSPANCTPAGDKPAGVAFSGGE